MNNATTYPVPDAAALLAAASGETGLVDVGDSDFVEPLARWLDALKREGGLNEMGVEIIRLNTLRLLVNRLRFVDDLKRHPEIRDEDVSDPIIVVGLPRTGTTKLQRLLACVNGIQGIAFWQLLNPAPFPTMQTGAPDPRIAAADEQLTMSRQLFPEFQAGHASRAEEVDEEVFMMEMSFEVLTYWRADVPSFMRWCRTRPRDNPYTCLVDLLKYVQWQNGGKAGRSLVLKCPLHLGYLDMIHKYFPRATVVHCHRDPRVSVASNARLHELMWKMAIAEVNPLRVGDEVVDYWSRALADNIKQRDALAGQLRILDVFYEDILSAPLDVVRSALEIHGRAVKPADIAAMVNWETRNPQGHSGKFLYSQKAYGLSDERIEREFATYMARFYPEHE